MYPISLEGKNALITGASQGIGREVALHLHAAGAKVIINHPGMGSSAADAKSLAESLNAVRAQSARELQADVSDPAQVESMMASIQEQDGGLDFLVNNAAILRDKSLKKLTLPDWDAVIAVNLSGVFYCSKFGLEIMREGGAIVSFGSIAAREGFFGQANYASAKAGVESLMKVVAREAGKRNIRANTVAPGVIETAMAEQIPQDVRDEMLKHVPLRRFGKAEEVARAVLFLCSPLASYVTGHTLEINGGWRS